jgi:hypothetical protein
MEATIKNGVSVEKVIKYLEERGVARIDAQKRLYYLKRTRGIVTAKSNGQTYYPENIFTLIDETKKTGPKNKAVLAKKSLKITECGFINHFSDDVKAILRINAKRCNKTVDQVMMEIINARVKEAMESVDLL